MGNSVEKRRLRAKQLNQAISGLGPAIIKGGQALASRPDLLPSEYLDELQKLQDDVPRFSNQLALETVESELGIRFDDVFELVQEEPVAAASIGQVYKARLLSNGETVALKIQRPRCEEIIALDLYVLRWWSGVYNKIFDILQRDIDVQSIIDDFGDLIYREIDYVAEAANAQRFNELYAGVTDVFVPKVYSDLTTSKVLTMEWVDGFRLTDNANLERFGLDRRKVRKKFENKVVGVSLRPFIRSRASCSWWKLWSSVHCARFLRMVSSTQIPVSSNCVPVVLLPGRILTRSFIPLNAFDLCLLVQTVSNSCTCAHLTNGSSQRIHPVEYCL